MCAPVIIKDTIELRDLRKSAKDAGHTVGFVPTMGALHEGHLSLVRNAKALSGFVVVSIFVNPTQFAPHEDFDSYPRDEEKDVALLAEAGADVVFLPTQAEIYPDGLDSNVKAGAEGDGLETDFRPHFFDGVVNVVHRLFQAVQPDLAVFGEKDFQQLQVIREMVKTQDMEIEIIGGEIVRDDEGLALSSRNAYLSQDELSIARRLNKVLLNAASAIKSGSGHTDVCAKAVRQIKDAGFDKVDYVDVRWNRILAAAWIGKTRLIDNFSIR